MQTVITLDEARRRVEAQFPRFAPAVESLPLAACPGRVLAQNAVAAANVPGFDRSAMDGYAVRAQDTFGASESMPAMLRCVGGVKMGEAPGFALSTGECAAVPTGGQLPDGADSVVMVENTTAAEDGTIFIETPAAPGNHVVYQGDDVKAGGAVLKAGRRLSAQDVGTLAALGLAEAAVYRRPVVGVLSTGDELAAHGAPLRAAQVHDVNGPLLAALAERAGGQAVPLGIARDDWDALGTALAGGLARCDMVLVSGGSSVGTLDMTARLIDAAGAPGVFVQGVAVKPGKPTIIGNAGGRPVFGLPGHPVSAALVFRVLAAPLLARMAGQSAYAEPPGLPARLAGNVPSGGGREEFVPVALSREDGEWVATPLWYKSGLVTTLAAADGYLHLPRNREGYRQGEVAAVLPLD